jgi:hypothetical protein
VTLALAIVSVNGMPNVYRHGEDEVVHIGFDDYGLRITKADASWSWFPLDHVQRVDGDNT